MCKLEKEGYALRAARPEEIDESFALYEKRVRWMDEKGIRQWNDTDYLSAYPADYDREMRERSCLYVLTDAAGKIVGAAVLLAEDEHWAGEEEAFYVHNLVTDTSAPGAGRLLLAAAEAMGRVRGKRYTRLDCAEDSAFLNEYYERWAIMPPGNVRTGRIWA